MSMDNRTCPFVHAALPHPRIERTFSRSNRSIHYSMYPRAGGPRCTIQSSDEGVPPMPTYLSPGVYMEEASSGSKPIEGVGSAGAAFAGFAEKGPPNQPTLVTKWTQFTQSFGDFVEGSYLAHAVYGYFLNGGGAAYIVRIGSDDDEGDAKAAVAHGDLPAGEGKPGLVVKALESGPAGDGITVETSDASEPGENNDQFKLIVKRGEKVEETFDNVSLRKGANNVATKVKADSKLISVEEVRGGGTLELRRDSR